MQRAVGDGNKKCGARAAASVASEDASWRAAVRVWGAQLQSSRKGIVRYAVKVIQSWLICYRSVMKCRQLQLGALYVVRCQKPMCFVSRRKPGPGLSASPCWPRHVRGRSCSCSSGREPGLRRQPQVRASLCCANPARRRVGTSPTGSSEC
jgi:hypothetical protein